MAPSTSYAYDHTGTGVMHHVQRKYIPVNFCLSVGVGSSLFQAQLPFRESKYPFPVVASLSVVVQPLAAVFQHLAEAEKTYN